MTPKRNRLKGLLLKLKESTVKQFLAQYFFNLWVYGSQAMILFFAGRKLVTLYAANKIGKRLADDRLIAERGATAMRNPDLRGERAT